VISSTSCEPVGSFADCRLQECSDPLPSFAGDSLSNALQHPKHLQCACGGAALWTLPFSGSNHSSRIDREPSDEYANRLTTVTQHGPSSSSAQSLKTRLPINTLFIGLIHRYYSRCLALLQIYLHCLLHASSINLHASSSKPDIAIDTQNGLETVPYRCPKWLVF
jgi:hypothetical protein